MGVQLRQTALQRGQAFGLTATQQGPRLCQIGGDILTRDHL